MKAQDVTMCWTREIDSTNRWAAREARSGAAHGTLFVAERQSAGRGRMERRWQSEGKGLYMTLLLRPDAQAIVLPRVPLLVALAVCETLCEMGVEARIKWPNDVIVNGRKICGILCESRAAETKVAWCVAGVGINLMQTREDFGEDIADKATSLFLELHEEKPAEQVIGRFLAAMERWYTLCVDDDVAFWTAYRERSATLGREVRVLEGERVWTGFAEEIRRDGSLLIGSEEGRRAVYAGDVSIRGLNGYV